MIHRSDRGATAVEYGLMIALIFIIAMAAVIAVGENMDAVFTEVGDTIESP